MAITILNNPGGSPSSSPPPAEDARFAARIFCRVELERFRNLIFPPAAGERRLAAASSFAPIQSYSAGADEDPVFDGLVRDFEKHADALEAVYDAAARLSEAFEIASQGVTGLAEVLVQSLSRCRDHFVASDVCKFKEASTAIGYREAPFSVLSKFRRDLAYNVIAPLKKHMAHNDQLRRRLMERKELVAEVRASRGALQSHLDAHNSRTTSRLDKQTADALLSEMKRAESLLARKDASILEWLLMLDAYRDDISDSLVQTMKYLEYEFFAGAAHAVARVLPKQMEFRPLLEMTPEHLESQVKLAMEKHQASNPKTRNATSRAIEALASQQEPPKRIAVDTMSLEVLVVQGFDESDARRALQQADGDVQRALDVLVDGDNVPIASGEISGITATVGNIVDEQVRASVRMPTTIQLMEDLREWDRQRRRRSGTTSSQHCQQNGSDEGKSEQIEEMRAGEPAAPRDEVDASAATATRDAALTRLRKAKNRRAAPTHDATAAMADKNRNRSISSTGGDNHDSGLDEIATHDYCVPEEDIPRPRRFRRGRRGADDLDEVIADTLRQPETFKGSQQRELSGELTARWSCENKGGGIRPRGPVESILDAASTGGDGEESSQLAAPGHQDATGTDVIGQSHLADLMDDLAVGGQGDQDDIASTGMTRVSSNKLVATNTSECSASPPAEGIQEPYHAMPVSAASPSFARVAKFVPVPLPLSLKELLDRQGAEVSATERRIIHESTDTGDIIAELPSATNAEGHSHLSVTLTAPPHPPREDRNASTKSLLPLSFLETGPKGEGDPKIKRKRRSPSLRSGNILSAGLSLLLEGENGGTPRGASRASDDDASSVTSEESSAQQANRGGEKKPDRDGTDLL